MTLGHSATMTLGHIRATMTLGHVITMTLGHVSATMTLGHISATMTLGHISAIMTYVMRYEERLWNVKVLQRVHVSNLVTFVFLLLSRSRLCHYSVGGVSGGTNFFYFNGIKYFTLAEVFNIATCLLLFLDLKV
jgi:hypothetical protein